jgi:hypothetical protein
MIEPTERDVGRKVIYTRPGGHGSPTEEGVITSVNPRYVFVCYSGQTSAATRREDLEWATRVAEAVDVSEGNPKKGGQNEPPGAYRPPPPSALRG